MWYKLVQTNEHNQPDPKRHEYFTLKANLTELSTLIPNFKENTRVKD